MLKIQAKIRNLSCDQYAIKCKRFFKTAIGEYSHGDIFLGVRSPNIRKLAKESIELPIKDMRALIRSKYHEERLLGLIILVNKFSKAKTEGSRKKFYQEYTNSFKYINNWDLVDVTCPHIIGKYLIDKDRSVLYEWAHSKDLWTKRISIVTNWWFIRNNDLNDVFKLSKILLTDEHDLIHKAVGWMLREAGKKDMKKLELYLKKYYREMPRTMLRYTIEKFPERKRQAYLHGRF